MAKNRDVNLEEFVDVFSDIYHEHLRITHPDYDKMDVNLYVKPDNHDNDVVHIDVSPKPDFANERLGGPVIGLRVDFSPEYRKIADAFITATRHEVVNLEDKLKSMTDADEIRKYHTYLNNTRDNLRSLKEKFSLRTQGSYITADNRSMSRLFGKAANLEYVKVRISLTDETSRQRKQ